MTLWIIFSAPEAWRREKKRTVPSFSLSGEVQSFWNKNDEPWALTILSWKPAVAASGSWAETRNRNSCREEMRCKRRENDGSKRVSGPVLMFLSKPALFLHRCQAAIVPASSVRLCSWLISHAASIFVFQPQSVTVSHSASLGFLHRVSHAQAPSFHRRLKRRPRGLRHNQLLKLFINPAAQGSQKLTAQTQTRTQVLK